MSERDYVLGTHDAELERLGLQHRVWRTHVLECWRRAGLRTGHTVVDVGCGPGYATLDLAQAVGARGSVLGLERSERFVAAARRHAAGSELSNVEFRQLDLVTDPWDVSGADATWCRWVLAFVNDPALVLRKIAAALRTGGRAVFHEYFDYRTWRLSPRSHAFEEFVSIVVANWRDSGGEPDIGLELPVMLAACGFRVEWAEPVVYAVRPDEPMWQWPDSFVRVHLPHLVETGRIDASWASEVQGAFDRAASTPGAFLVTPAVLEVIAEKTP
jgi:SAM-dependent methyltransferase